MLTITLCAIQCDSDATAFVAYTNAFLISGLPPSRTLDFIQPHRNKSKSGYRVSQAAGHFFQSILRPFPSKMLGLPKRGGAL
jgi:hypothetical protein